MRGGGGGRAVISVAKRDGDASDRRARWTGGKPDRRKGEGPSKRGGDGEKKGQTNRTTRHIKERRGKKTSWKRRKHKEKGGGKMGGGRASVTSRHRRGWKEDEIGRNGGSGVVEHPSGV